MAAVVQCLASAFMTSWYQKIPRNSFLVCWQVFWCIPVENFVTGSITISLAHLNHDQFPCASWAFGPPLTHSSKLISYSNLPYLNAYSISIWDYLDYFQELPWFLMSTNPCLPLHLYLHLSLHLTTLLHSAPSRKLLPNASVSLELNCLVFKMN